MIQKLLSCVQTLSANEAFNLPDQKYRRNQRWPVHFGLPETFRCLPGARWLCRNQFYTPVAHLATMPPLNLYSAAGATSQRPGLVDCQPSLAWWNFPNMFVLSTSSRSWRWSEWRLVQLHQPDSHHGSAATRALWCAGAYFLLWMSLLRV